MVFAHASVYVVYPGFMNGRQRINFHTPLIVLAGLCAAQVIGTLQVYQSNAHLHRTVTAVKNAGYLAIPNDLAAATLTTVKAAFLGGLFFTLSIGAGVTILALLSTWIWKYVCRRSPLLAIPFLLPWIGCVIALNLRGPAVLPSLYFTVVPLLVAVLTLKLTPAAPLDRSGWAWCCLHPIILLLVAFFWFTQYNPDMFSHIRDRLLLTHSPGIAFNNFYYRYTLYPAEVFKSLDQKMIKTCQLEGLDNRSSREAVLDRLAGWNYLAVQDAENVDLEVKAVGNEIELAHQGRALVRTPLKNFVENPEQALKTFSRESDRFRFFRQATFICLLLAFPIMLYIFVSSLLYWLAALFFIPGRAAVLAGLLCLLFGCLLILPVRSGLSNTVAPDSIPGLLQSGKWQDNVDALKALVRLKNRFPRDTDGSGLAASPNIPVRYWLARSLAHSSSSQTYATLMQLMDDPQPIVVCQALYSLGRRKEAQSLGPVLEKINQSDHWYIQWYGYNALKALGWRQKSSI